MSKNANPPKIMPQSLKLACIIDDDTVYIKLVKKLLEVKKLCDDILVFENGKEAIEYFKKSKVEKVELPQLILLDLNMPVMNGWEFLDEFDTIHESLDVNPSLYVVSSSIDPIDSKKARSKKFVEDYISKPISLKTFEVICKKIAS